MNILPKHRFYNAIAPAVTGCFRSQKCDFSSQRTVGGREGRLLHAGTGAELASKVRADPRFDSDVSNLLFVKCRTSKQEHHLKGRGTRGHALDLIL